APRVRLLAAPATHKVESVEHEGNPLASVQRVPVAEMEMKVRADGVSGVTDAADDLAAADTVTDLERDAAGLQVRVEGEAIGSEGEAHLIAGDGLPRDRDRGTDLSRGLGNILG